MATPVDEVQSLDDAQVPMWTFYSTEGKERFTIPVEVAKMSGVFASMIEMSENERAVSLSVIKQTFDNSQEVFEVNTDKLFRYVYEYLMMWEPNLKKSDYVKVGPVQTSEIQHVLQDIDIKFIEGYLADYLAGFKGTISEVRRQKVKGLGVLLAQVDGVLDIQSLANKLYAYIAVTVWNTSIVDFAEAMNDPAFRKAQEAAIDTWKQDNPNRFAGYVRSHTTGDITLPPTNETSPEDLEELEDFSLATQSRGANNTAEASDSDSDVASESE